MSDRLPVRTRVILIAATAVALLALVYLRLAGSAVVVDETDGVESAFIVTGDGRQQRLHRVWRGYFYAIPELEGAIEIRCRDGSRTRWGYVSGLIHEKVRVVGDTPCASLVHDL